jgi:hypothetical protein
MNTHHFFIIPEATEKVISYDSIRKQVYAYNPEDPELASLKVTDRHDNPLYDLQPVTLLDILEQYEDLVDNRYNIVAYNKTNSEDRYSFIFSNEDSVEAFNEVFVDGEQYKLAEHLPDNQFKIKNIVVTKVGESFTLTYEDGSEIVKGHGIILDKDGIEELKLLKESEKFAVVGYTIFDHSDWMFDHEYEIVNSVQLKNGKFESVRDFVHTMTNEEESESTTITPKDGSEMTPEKIKEIILGHVQLSLDDVVDFTPEAIED